MCEDLIAMVRAAQTEQTSSQAAYILACIEKGWSLRQMRARFSQSRDAFAWQARYGNPHYRATNTAAADLFAAVCITLDGAIERDHQA